MEKILFEDPNPEIPVTPLPTMVKVFSIVGKELPRSISLPRSNIAIVSLPVPELQSPPVVSVLPFALLIASRRLQRPSPEMVSSSSVLTIMVVAKAGKALKSASITSPAATSFKDFVDVGIIHGAAEPAARKGRTIRTESMTTDQP